MTSGGLRFRGKRYHWLNDDSVPEPSGLGRDRKIMGFRIVNGTREPIGIMTTSHPALSGNTAMPKSKRRTVIHNKGTVFPGMWR